MMMTARPRSASAQARPHASSARPPASSARPHTHAPRGRRHSADGIDAALPARAEGYARLKRRGALTWSTRFLVLRGSALSVFYAKEDAGRGAARGRTGRPPVMEARVTGGRVAAAPELALELLMADGREWLARVFSRADVAAWATAFHRLAADELAAAAALADPAEDAEQTHSKAADGKRRVSFHRSVLVRTIPALADEQVPELFYSAQEVARFSQQASSLRARTGDAVASALSFRRRRDE